MYQTSPDTSTKTIDRLPVKQLIAVANITRATFYQRVKLLGIKFEKNGRDCYATADQIQLLKDYDTAIARGEGDEFLRKLNQPKTGKYDISPRPVNSEIINNQNSLLIDHALTQESVIAQLLTTLLPTKSLLEPQQSLQKAADNRWILSTRQVHELIKIKPKGQAFERYGFLFHRYGTREWSIQNRHKP